MIAFISNLSLKIICQQNDLKRSRLTGNKNFVIFKDREVVRSGGGRDYGGYKITLTQQWVKSEGLSMMMMI